MCNVEIEQTKLPGVVIVTPKRFGDARGFFSESWSKRTMAAAGFDFDWVQDNHSVSAQAGTVRGLVFSGAAPRAGQIGALCQGSAL